MSLNRSHSLVMGSWFEASNEYSGLMIVIAVKCCLLPVRDGREVPASDSRSWIVSVSCSNYIPSLKCVPVTQLSHGLVPCSLYKWRRGKLSTYYISKKRLAAAATELNDTFGCRSSIHVMGGKKISCEWEAVTHGRHATIALLEHRLYTYILYK